ncbi:acyltransferase family-domain-containing protein [Colletotrichum cereale]|nr:acyltransferase family-domain-containing protein [Colletotrichum cereale]
MRLSRFLQWAPSRDEPYMVLPDNEDGGSSLPRDQSEKSSWGINAQVRNILWSLLPSFVSRPIRRRYDLSYNEDYDGKDGAIPQPNATSYLNGLRGIASLVVALQHNVEEYFPLIHRGWGDEPDDTHIIQLPFVRLIIHGSFSVALFFVISGFALSYGPLKKIHRRETIDVLSSSVLRRPFRLFLPVIPILVFSNFILVRWLGALYVSGSMDVIQPQSSLWAEIQQSWTDFRAIIVSGDHPDSVPQTWTLSVEYQGSLLVFLCCQALARVATVPRFVSMAAIFWWQWSLGNWGPGLFLAGMMIADLRELRPKLPILGQRAGYLISAANWLMLLMGLFFGGWPLKGNGGATLGFSYFNWVPTGEIAQQWFWYSVSAIMLVLSLENMPGGMLQTWLDARWVLYLGEISYGLYLVHFAVWMNPLAKGKVWSLMMNPAWISFWGSWSNLSAWLLGFIAALPFCIWIADLYWRFVDKTSVRLARWLGDVLAPGVIEITSSVRV